VYHVPDLNANLLSVQHLTERGFEVTFNGSECKILANGEIAAIARKQFLLYILEVSSRETARAEILQQPSVTLKSRTEFEAISSARRKTHHSTSIEDCAMQMVGLPQCRYAEPTLSRFDMGSINPAMGLATSPVLEPSVGAIENPTHLPGEEPGEAPPALAPAARNDTPHFVNIPAQCEKTMGVVSVTADAVGVNKDISGTYQHKYQSNPKSRINPRRAVDPNQSRVSRQSSREVQRMATTMKDFTHFHQVHSSPTNEQIVDVLTKPLSARDTAKFVK
jgi:hypothetical protein